MAAGPIVLYPRAHITVKYIYNDGDEFTTGMLPSRASVTLRPHHQCGTCEVEFNAAAVPFDLRRLNGVFMSVFMGAAASMNEDVQQEKYLQFVGYADSESVRRSPDGTRVTVAARDLSALLRDLKPMYQILSPAGASLGGGGKSAASTAGTLSPISAAIAAAATQVRIPLDPTPRYTDTIVGAIRRILQWAGLDDGQFEIDDRSGRGSVTLTSLTSERGVQGRLPIKHRDVSAWEAIEHVAAVANVLVSVDLGKIVLRKPSDAFVLPDDPKSPPKYSFAFGKMLDNYTNCYEVEVTKKFIRNRKGVRLIAYEPKSKSIITADFPPDSGVAPKRAPTLGATKQSKPRKVSLHVGGGVTNASSVPDAPRDVVSVGGDGVQSQGALNDLAERYYRERAPQELEGALTTYVWDDALFSLRNGDRFEIRVKAELETELLNQPDEASQIAFLRRHFRVNDDAARVMLKQTRGKESTLFYLRSVKHDWSTSEAKTTIDFISLVEV